MGEDFIRMIQERDTSVSARVVARAFMFVQHPKVCRDQTWRNHLIVPDELEKIKELVLDSWAKFEYFRGDTIRARSLLCPP